MYEEQSDLKPGDVYRDRVLVRTDANGIQLWKDVEPTKQVIFTEVEGIKPEDVPGLKR